MNQDEFATSTEPATSNLPLPGQLIYQTREQRGLSVPDLSEKTHLTENVIHAVERDDFTAMGKPVYARGYYRKCGEALGLNAERLVEAYEQHSGTGSPVPTIDQRPSIAYREGPGKVALSIAIGLMLLVFVVCGVWVLGDEDAAAPASAAPMAQNKQPVDADKPQAGKPQAVQPQVENEPANATSPDPKLSIPDAALAQVQDQGAASHEPESETGPEAAVNTGPTDQKPTQQQQPQLHTAAEQQTVVSQPKAQPAAQKTSATEQAQSAAQPVAAGNQNIDVQVVIAQGEAWVDIRDKDGQKLLYKLLQDGDKRTFQGRAPLQVSLGRADHVSLLINGQAVDFAAQIDKGLTANFMLNANGRPFDRSNGETP